MLNEKVQSKYSQEEQKQQRKQENDHWGLLNLTLNLFKKKTYNILSLMFSPNDTIIIKLFYTTPKKQLVSVLNIRPFPQDLGILGVKILNNKCNGKL